MRNGRIGVYYAAAAIAAFVVGLGLLADGSLCFGRAVRSAMVAAGYLGLGCGVYRKRGAGCRSARACCSGRCCWATDCRYYITGDNAGLGTRWLPALLIGRRLSGKEARAAVSRGSRRCSI